MLTIRRRANRGGVSEPYSLFLWRCGRRGGPSLERWGDVLVTSVLCVMGAPGLPRSGRGGQRAGRCGLTVREAEARSVPRPHRGGGVSADTNPEIAETLVQSAEVRREQLILCAGSEAMMTRARLPMSCCFRGGDRGAQCSAGADRGHSVKIQWPITPVVLCLSRYDADATLRPVDHSAVSSRRPAGIAGVVDVLMGHDVLLGRSVEAGVTGYGQAGLERYRE